MALDRKTIVKTALKLLDDVGLEGLTTRRLADELGVKGPSLYWHFKSKDELLDHMAEAMLTRALRSHPPSTPAAEWWAWLAGGAWVVRRAALSHRDGARILAGRRPTGSQPALSTSAMMERMAPSGLSPTEARDAMFALNRFTLGWVMHEQMVGDREPHIDHEAGFAFGVEMMIRGIRERAAEGHIRSGVSIPSRSSANSS